MNLLKTSFFSAVSTGIKVLAGFVTSKIIAIYAGPTGIALIGQFQNVLAVIFELSNGAIESGTVKYVAEHRDNHNERIKYLSTSFLISIVFAALISAVLIFLNKNFSIYFLKDEQYSSIFLILGLIIVLISLNNYFNSVLNGFKEIKKLLVLQIISNLASFIFMIFLVIFWGVYGALLALVTSHAVVFIVTMYFVFSSNWFRIKNFLGCLDVEAMKKLFKFSFITVTVAITVPIAQIIIRNFITDSISSDAAGFWQGLLKITEVYVLIITTSLTIYYIPKLSEIKDSLALRKEVFHGFKIIIPIIIAMALAIYFLRDFIILLIFTEEFLPMKALFPYQLLGDVLKASSWLLVSIMMAKAMIKEFFITHVLFIISYVSLSILFIDRFGLVGVTFSYALAYLLLFGFMLFAFRNLLIRGVL